MIDQSQQVPEELQVAAMNTREPGRLADLLGSSLPFTIEEKQHLLSETNVKIRLEKLGAFLTRQLTVLELSSKIQAQVGSEITKAQRDHFLRQQIKAIQDELGETESDNPELDELWEKLEKAKPPAEVLAEAEREMDRLAGMHPSSAEYSIVRTYLDWLAVLPWDKSSRDRLDLRRARKILDADHYDLEKIKERILEYLAVRKLKKDMKGPILCFAGPPGTGKTSLGKSIAKALGRQFVRVSLGGVHDEAEIRGHRRTYVAAMPGRVIQGIRKSGTNNPVFMLDEVDKLGADFRGDPSAALLEVLDPEQNATFPRPLSRRRFRPVQGHVHRHGEHAGDDPRPLARPDGSDRAGGLQRGRKGPDRQEIHRPQATRSPRVRPSSWWSSRTSRSAGSSPTTPARPACGTSNARSPPSAGRSPASTPRGTRPATTVVPDMLWPRCSARLGSSARSPTAPARPASPPAWPGPRPAAKSSSSRSRGCPARGRLTLTGLLGESMRESAQAALSYLRSHAKEMHLDVGQDHQDRPAHPRSRRSRAQGRPLGRRGHRRRPDEPVPAPGHPSRNGHDRRGHADRPGLAGRRGPRESPRRPTGRDHDRPDPGTTKKTWSSFPPRSRPT